MQLLQYAIRPHSRCTLCRKQQAARPTEQLAQPPVAKQQAGSQRLPQPFAVQVLGADQETAASGALLSRALTPGCDRN